MKKIVLFVSMAGMALLANATPTATQNANLATTRQLGDTVIKEELTVYNGIVREIRTVNDAAPDTITMRCNRDCEGNAVLALWQAQWSCQSLLEQLSKVAPYDPEEYDYSPNNHFIMNALNRCSQVAQYFAHGGCQNAANFFLKDVKHALAEARDADEPDDQLNQVAQIIANVAPFRELQHCGYLY
ncbi:MAG: hypothetical protein MJZ75_01840 [Paludibacteraceae bacterium]|nr:hypothetical protein [Paludibacteraceae bacterium]